MIAKELFIESVNALRDQHDKEVARAKTLSEIYGSDIDPVDNSLLTNIILENLRSHFPVQEECDIAYFCYEQDFGRKINKGPEALWVDMVNTINVVYEVVKASHVEEKPS